MAEYGIKSLRQIQMSRETAIRTPTTDYTVWRGTGTIQDMRVVVFPDEDVGVFGGTDRQYVPQKMGELVMEDTPATYEQLGHIFDAAFYEATPAADGGGTGYVRTYTMPQASTDIKQSTDLQTYGFKGGDNVDVEYAKGSFVRSFSLSGNSGEAVNVTATWETSEVASDTDGFETATTPAVEEILFSKAKLYIDNDTDTIGTSQITGSFISADLSVTTGWKSIFSADGSLEYTDLKQVMPEIMLNVTFEHTAAGVVAEKAAWRAGTARLIRIIAEGSDLGTTATYDYKTLILDLAGKWESFEAMGDEDGDDIVTGTFRCRYNATSAKFFEAVLVNEVDAL
jgi:hypothetical protein